MFCRTVSDVQRHSEGTERSDGRPENARHDAVRISSEGAGRSPASSPQQFRDVPLSEATETLRDQYEERIERLQSALRDDETYLGSQSGTTGLVALDADTGENTVDDQRDATRRVVLVIDSEAVLTEPLSATRFARVDAGVDVIGAGVLFVGAVARGESPATAIEWTRLAPQRNDT
ncbi:hypothetical protein C8039_17340 [Halogeometricum sp. wsp3]|nr:hypothetical protein C8039_17340 [Halogeometricum sp. wsp3]